MGTETMRMVVKFDGLEVRVKLVIIVTCLISSHIQLSGYRHKVDGELG